MSVSVKMPQLGESVVEGTVTRWLKQEGDVVALDEPLLEVSTDKVDTEIPSPAAGVILRVLALEDEVVAVGAELAVIGEANEAPLRPTEAAPAQPSSPPADPAPATPPTPAPATPAPAPTPPAPPAPAPAEPAAATSASTGKQTSVVLPALGESVAEGTVTRWLKAVGDPVAMDEPLVEVSTDKVDTEIPSPVAGVLLSIAVPEDEVVAVGGELAVIGAAAGGPADAAPQPSAPPATPPSPAPTAPQDAPVLSAPTPESTTINATSGDVGYVTPLVRKLAAEYRVDLSTIAGTGVGGRIRKDDVLEAAKRAAQQAAPAPTPASGARAPSTPSTDAGAPSAPSPLRGRTEKMTRLRKVIAQRMVESLQVSAQLTTVVEIDVSRIAALRQRAKSSFESREGVKLSFLPFFAKAVVEALKVHPSLNASIDGAAGTVTYHDSENLGVAVDTERGLLVPVIHGAGDLSVAGLAKRISEVAERTRTGKISPDELAGGTFTLTNTGSRGALFDTPIINQPQVAVLGTGSVVKRPVVVTDDSGSDSIAVRSMVYLALTYDHRLVDGADAARFLGTVKARLEDAAFEGEL